MRSEFHRKPLNDNVHEATQPLVSVDFFFFLIYLLKNFQGLT